MTAVANVFLGSSSSGSSRRWSAPITRPSARSLRNPLIALPLLALILSATIHMRLGMQTIIEDYVHEEGLKLAALVLNTFFAISIALASVFAILKLSFGA